jgi:hypothetical protein
MILVRGGVGVGHGGRGGVSVRVWVRARFRRGVRVRSLVLGELSIVDIAAAVGVGNVDNLLEKVRLDVEVEHHQHGLELGAVKAARVVLV